MITSARMPTASTSHQDTAYLDGARGLAAAIVVAGHCSNKGLHLIPGLDLSATAKAGVWLFFVLSAFLLAKKLVQDIDRGGIVAIFNYCVRRAFRILPLYFCVLTGLLLLGYIGATDYPWHLALLQGQDHFWTIPVEMTFYLVLIALAVCLSALPPPYRFLAAALAYAGSLAIYFIAGPAGIVANSTSLIHYGPFFMAGVVLAFAPLLKVNSTAGIVLAVLGLAVAVGSSPRSMVALWGGTVEHALEWSWLFSGAWFAFLLGAARAPLIRRWLSSRWLTSFGTASFGVYLVHFHLLEWAAQFKWMPSFFLGWGVVMASALIGWLSYWRFEKPVLDRATVLARQILSRFAPAA